MRTALTAYFPFPAHPFEPDVEALGGLAVTEAAQPEHSGKRLRVRGRGLRGTWSLVISIYHAHLILQAFFESHGSRIRQLELGHSSATIEEYWLSRGLEAGAPGGILRGREGLLAGWCSNLKEFICSADAEWNWHDPDRIRPHTLLKSHPTLLFIGVRDIEKRLRDDLELARARRRGRRGPDGVEVQ